MKVCSSSIVPADLKRKILGLSQLKRYFTISILIPAKYSLLTRERRTLSQYGCLFATTNQPHTWWRSTHSCQARARPPLSSRLVNVVWDDAGTWMRYKTNKKDFLLKRYTQKFHYFIKTSVPVFRICCWAIPEHFHREPRMAGPGRRPRAAPQEV